MISNSPRLSKSRYMSGKQCHLRLWYDVHERQLASPIDEAQQAIFDTGHEVGDLARQRYPGGHLISHDYRHIPQALAETRRLVKSGTAPALFEAAFQHNGVLARVDVLERMPGGGWRMVEVKSTTRCKPEHIIDTAVQLWVLRGVGLDVRDACVLTLNREYIYDGMWLDLDALFKLHPVFDETSTLLESVGTGVADMQAMLAADTAPDIASGDHCLKPYVCPYYEHCTRDIPKPEHGVSELTGMKADRRKELQSLGVTEVKDVPDDFSLSRLQSVIRQAVSNEHDIMHGDLANALTTITPPIRYLDFETFQSAIPRFAGTRCYDQIAFLFSVHTETDDASPQHVDYIHEGDDDPRKMLIERLLDALGDEGSICVYSSFERTQINAFAAAFPLYADALDAIATRLVDLLPVVKKSYYHPAFHGSFSIKSVLPAIVPSMGYDDLEVADGRMAAVQYARALSSADGEEKRKIFDNLRAYCARDTLAMVELHKALMVLAKSDA